jgi:regulator of RNase E activity RraA
MQGESDDLSPTQTANASSARVMAALGRPFDALHELGVAHVTDACRALGVPYQLADDRLRRIVPDAHLAGIALTLRLYLAKGARPYVDQAIEQFERGASIDHATLVVRNEVPGFDTLGSFDARLARAAGYRGYVVEGPVRDTDALARLGFPVFATAIRADCIRRSDLPVGVGVAFEFASPIDVAGMTVATGMVVVADGDGVVTFASGRLGEIVESAAAIANNEQRLVAILDGGARVAEVLRESVRDTEARPAGTVRRTGR